MRLYLEFTKSLYIKLKWHQDTRCINRQDLTANKELWCIWRFEWKYYQRLKCMLCQEKKEKKQDMAIRVRADLGSEYVSQNLRFGRWENFSYRYAPQSKNLNISMIFHWSNISIHGKINWGRLEALCHTKYCLYAQWDGKSFLAFINLQEGIWPQ